LQGHYAQSEEYLQNALSHEQKAGGAPNDISIVLLSLANLASVQGNYAQALGYFQKALALVEKNGDPLIVASILSDLAETLSRTDNDAEALAYFRRSLTLSEHLGAKINVTAVLRGIAELETSQHAYDAAFADYRKALAIAEESGEQNRVSELLDSMGDAYNLEEDYATALSYHLKSLALAEKLGYQQTIDEACRGASSDYFHQGKFNQAVEYAERASQIAQDINDREGFWQARTATGEAYRALGQAAKAQQAFDEATGTIEVMWADVAGGEQERQRFFETKVTPYQRMVELLVDQNRNAEALSFAERAKGRTLLAVLDSGRIQITKAMTDAERDQERKLEDILISLNAQIQEERQLARPDQARLETLQKRLAEARVTYNQFHIRLYAAHPELRTQRGQALPLTVDEMVRILPQSGALLEFLVGEKKTYLFVVTRTSPGTSEVKVYPLEIKQEELAQKADEFRRKLALRDLNVRAAARELYDLLLKPAERQLAGKDALVIVPDGPLWNLPFQALREGNRYLLQKYAIAYSPSFTVLREMMRLHDKNRQGGAASQSPTLLAMADPVLDNESMAHVAIAYRDEKLEPLPEARHEVQALKQLYSATRSEVYTGQDAREDRFKIEAGRFRILHLATHGTLDNASPLYSNVVLSPGDSGKEDGLLEAREIMQMDLKADLAVLSACETARGHISAGEGVIGLSWAFFVAGTSTTVVSQWKVASVSTADLMVAFHRHLMTAPKNGSMAFSSARALQQAELELLRTPKYAHPFYWAGFIIVGDPD
jgi:CHAT domain-containing protein